MTIYDYILIGILVLVQSESIWSLRLCCPGKDTEEHCKNLQTDLAGKPVRLSCIAARDRYECLEFLIKDYADVVLADPEDAYIAEKKFSSKLVVLGKTVEKDRAGEAARYESVAVVRKSTIKSVADLHGARSCHTGYKKTAGWHIPISQLIRMKRLSKPCSVKYNLSTVEQDFKAASSYFGAACIPGKWSPNPKTDIKLKSKYSKLCSLCSNPKLCDGEDRRSGYEGALRCLTEAQADVAWTKLSVAKEFFRKNPGNGRKFGYLCKNGKISSSLSPCFWGKRPWKIWLTSSRSQHSTLAKSLQSIMESPVKPYSEALFGTKKQSVFKKFSEKYSTKKYMNDHSDYMNTITMEVCTSKPVRLCVESEAAMKKCQAMSIVFKSRRIRPGLSCVFKEQGCYKPVRSFGADAMMAGPSELYKGYRSYRLEPIISEKYGLLPLSYYAVALIKANSQIKSLEDLRGKRSCHTGVGRTAGWKIPVSVLTKKGFLVPKCNITDGLANFFSMSCIPGIKDKSFDVHGNISESLCGLCPREEISLHDKNTVAYSFDKPKHGKRCTKTEAEPYYGYSGAFRCLAEGGGDVAFVKHTTLGDNTNGNSVEPWSKNLHSRDFKLLCPNGGIADPVEFSKCYWGRVPSRKLLVRRGLGRTRKEDIKILMSSALTKFPAKQNIFSLFGSFHNESNVIFKDETTSFDLLEGSGLGLIEKEFFKILDVCSGSDKAHPATLVAISMGLLLMLQKQFFSLF